MIKNLLVILTFCFSMHACSYYKPNSYLINDKGKIKNIEEALNSKDDLSSLSVYNYTNSIFPSKEIVQIEELENLSLQNFRQFEFCSSESELIIDFQELNKLTQLNNVSISAPKFSFANDTPIGDRISEATFTSFCMENFSIDFSNFKNLRELTLIMPDLAVIDRTLKFPKSLEMLKLYSENARKIDLSGLNETNVRHIDLLLFDSPAADSRLVDAIQNLVNIKSLNELNVSVRDFDCEWRMKIKENVKNSDILKLRPRRICNENLQHFNKY